MAYTPELSQESSAILRRIAWSMNLPMTKTQEVIYKKILTHLDKQEICKACRDQNCNACAFKNPS